MNGINKRHIVVYFSINDLEEEDVKNKFFILAPIAAIVAVFIFSLTLFPSVQPQPKNLPIAIVNEDEGVTIPGQGEMNLGNTMLEMMQQNAVAASGDDEPAVKWIQVESKDAVLKGLDDKDYYAALVIPADYSVQQSSLATPAPTNPALEIYINQGMNTVAATMATQLLNTMVDTMNTNVRTQLLAGFAAQNMSLTAEQVAAIAVPIEKIVTTVNAPGPNSASGNMPLSLFQPLWIGSLAAAVILFFAAKKHPVDTTQRRFMQRLIQLGVAVIAAFIIGFGLPWLADAMVGFDIPEYMPTALFLTITTLAFIAMILAVLSVIGFPGIAIFVLLLFFGAPLLSFAPEMLSGFYQDFVYSWLPMRFMIEGLREIFFFGTGVTWANTQVLVWIMIVSILVILLSAFMPKKQAE